MNNFLSFSPKTALLNMVDGYRLKAQKMYLSGRRPYYLPCEIKIGGHCAVMFENDLQVHSIPISVKKFVCRCPKGKVGAAAGLISGALIFLTTFGSNNLCDRPEDELGKTLYDCSGCGAGYIIMPFIVPFLPIVYFLGQLLDCFSCLSNPCQFLHDDLRCLQDKNNCS